MTAEATILVPTHDHADLIAPTLESARAQDVEDIEIFVVGDGAPPRTKEIVLGLASEDPRVRYFDNPKGPRHGEIHRHRALEHATGRIVCYLSDDDLYLPDHVSTMLGALEDRQFVSALPLMVLPDGDMRVLAVDLEVDWWRQQHRENVRFNRIPLSCGAHTLAAYRSLDEGWSTTPEDTWTDRHMWVKFLSRDDVTARVVAHPTVLHFPSPQRSDASGSDRLRESQRWLARLRSAEGCAEVRAAAQEAVYRYYADAAQRRHLLHDRVESLREHNTELRSQLQAERRRVERIRTRLRQRNAQLEKVKHQLAAARDRERRLQRQVERFSWMRDSLTWRIRERLVGLPGIGAAIRRWRRPGAGS